MIKIEKPDQISTIQVGDIVVKYPSNGVSTESFAGRNLENSIAYEVAGKNDATNIIDLTHPNAANRSTASDLHKRYTDLVTEKVWWVAKY